LLGIGLSFLPTTPGHTRAHWLSSEDYSQYGDDVTTVLPSMPAPDGGPLKPCDYKPCLENQVPCSQLAASTRCLCPGFTLHSEVPDAPDLRTVSWNGSEVVVRWCAPYSYVTAYHVTIGGQERRKFGKDQRSGGVGKVEDVLLCSCHIRSECLSQ
uniref:Fibronectin type-III domain-containing protein n=1 Tax=Takifugu rubripes TaxID=31033 RepID=A0A3B5KM66_TAKRU